MYTQKSKIIICKFYIHGKCKFGSDCNYLHIQSKELSKLFEQLVEAQKTNESLKTELKEKNQVIKELELERNNNYQSKKDTVHTLNDRLFSSLFVQNENSKDETKTIDNQKRVKNGEESTKSNDNQIESIMKRIENIEQSIEAKNKYYKQIETNNTNKIKQIETNNDNKFKEIDTIINIIKKKTIDEIDAIGQNNSKLDQNNSKIDEIFEYMTKKETEITPINNQLMHQPYLQEIMNQFIQRYKDQQQINVR